MSKCFLLWFVFPVTFVAANEVDPIRCHERIVNFEEGLHHPECIQRLDEKSASLLFLIKKFKTSWHQPVCLLLDLLYIVIQVL